MSELFKREIPLGIGTFIIALLFFDYYISIEATANLATSLTNWAIIITATAAGVGVINMIIRTLQNITNKEEYWYLDIYMLAIMVLMTITGLIGAYGTNPIFEWVMMNAYLPIDASIYAMVFFDIVSSFYRTFRIRSRDSAIIFICAFIMMVRNAPLTGGMLPSFIPIGDWLLQIPSTAGSRAFTIVASIGVVAFTIRTMLQGEKTTVGVVE